MNISDCPISKIMKLPKHLFGRRFIVQLNISAGITGTSYGISSLAFPERCVIWSRLISLPGESLQSVSLGLRLGDELPVTDAIFDALEEFLPVICLLVSVDNLFDSL